MTLQDRMEAFPLGCCVRLTDKANASQRRWASKTGIVVGHPVYMNAITVLRDGLRTPTEFHVSFWERADSTQQIEEHW